MLALLCITVAHAQPATVDNTGQAASGVQTVVELTPEEQAWLAAHPSVPFCVDPDWQPFEWIDEQGRHAGIGADLLALAASRTGINLQLFPTRSWTESLAASRRGDCLVLSFLNQTPARDEWLIFTEPMMVEVNVFITREEHPFIADPLSLHDEIIVLPEGTAVEEWVRNDLPNLQVITVPTEREALQMVNSREADMTLRSLTMAAETIRSEGWFNLKIAGQAQNYSNFLRAGVVSEHPLLRDILNKGIATLTAAERYDVIDRHVSINVTTAVDYELVRNILIAFVLVAASSLFWILKLRALNHRLQHLSRTDTLTGLYNRSYGNTVFEREIQRARRYQRALSVIMVDADHFKRVNDELGHLVGDKVLQELASIIRAQVRPVDVVCRWGGEEILIICPETSREAVRILAQRLIEAVRESRFSSQRQQTISAGVATWRTDDNVDSLIRRADEAMYLAKRNGRDQLGELDVDSAEPLVP